MIEDNKKMPASVAGMLGGITGVIACIILESSLPSFKGGETLQIYQRKDKPTVARHYRDCADSILVQDPTNKQQFISMGNYLRTIKDVGAREAEEVEIKRTVEWYTK